MQTAKTKTIRTSIRRKREEKCRNDREIEPLDEYELIKKTPWPESVSDILTE
jgi:hypothetical protein